MRHDFRNDIYDLNGRGYIPSNLVFGLNFALVDIGFGLEVD